MGICLSCLNGPSEDYDEPDPETRRRQLAEAADRRMAENERKGIKDPDTLKRKQKRQDEMEKRAETQGGSEGGGLRWQVG
ncbi:small VCP/p97-interacting protein-like [Gigantopelta aegis]|uniref:small VCP/p97-interacting protein-like n=1 Tax=Gigantopelta aegis TaxID=1735272 RepID=UPI001B8884FD|nr:small VCP/p97-interacting protein-like [Gigantopelta aegis]